MEGFDSARECLREIQTLVKKDDADRKKMMQELQAKLRKSKELWNKRCQLVKDTEADAKADSKSSEDNDSKAGVKGTETKGDHTHTSDLKAVAGEAKGQDREVAEGEGQDDLDQDIDIPVMMFFQPVSMDALLDQVTYPYPTSNIIVFVIYVIMPNILNI